MAKMRNHAAVRSTAGWADWKVIERFRGSGLDPDVQQARLENGHTLNVSSFGRPGKMDNWDYHITDDKGEVLGHGGADDDDNPTGGRGGRGIKSLDEAKQLAEEHYRNLFPIGTDTGTHDSGVDYSDLNQLMRDQGF